MKYLKMYESYIYFTTFYSFRKWYGICDQQYVRDFVIVTKAFHLQVHIVHSNYLELCSRSKTEEKTLSTDNNKVIFSKCQNFYSAGFRRQLPCLLAVHFVFKIVLREKGKQSFLTINVWKWHNSTKEQWHKNLHVCICKILRCKKWFEFLATIP